MKAHSFFLIDGGDRGLDGAGEMGEQASQGSWCGITEGLVGWRRMENWQTMWYQLPHPGGKRCPVGGDRRAQMNSSIERSKEEAGAVQAKVTDEKSGSVPNVGEGHIITEAL